MSEPACTSMRVEMPSSRPCPLRFRARSATLTSFEAVAASTPASWATISASTSWAG